MALSQTTPVTFTASGTSAVTYQGPGLSTLAGNMDTDIAAAVALNGSDATVPVNASAADILLVEAAISADLVVIVDAHVIKTVSQLRALFNQILTRASGVSTFEP